MERERSRGPRNRDEKARAGVDCGCSWLCAYWNDGVKTVCSLAAGQRRRRRQGVWLAASARLGGQQERTAFAGPTVAARVR